MKIKLYYDIDVPSENCMFVKNAALMLQKEIEDTIKYLDNPDSGPVGIKVTFNSIDILDALVNK